jgi:hypothetical protein
MLLQMCSLMHIKLAAARPGHWPPSHEGAVALAIEATASNGG